MADEKEIAKVRFDPNEGAREFLIPGVEGIMHGASIINADAYHAALDALSKDLGVSSYEAALKALGVPPTAFAYSRIEYMPDPNAQGILPWPGIAPEALGKIARENVAPQLIIGMRVDDVLRYSRYSTHNWKPGWRIEPVEHTESPSEATLKDIMDAKRFLWNSNIETGYAKARIRDDHRLTNFQRFLAAGTRDWLTYDGLAIWTDMDNGGKVKGYTLLPAGHIRLAAHHGYEGNPDIFAVGVDEGGKVIATFTREQLTFLCRNPRTNVEASGNLFANGYGWSEIEISVRLIQGFQNVIDFNVDSFSRNSTPNGILTVHGVTQRQLDFLNRLWTNMKRGITKAWALPVVGLQGDKAKMEVIDLSGVKGKEGYYEEWQNMLAGMFCTIYRFPVRRLGYRMSGKGRDTEPLPDSSGKAVDEDDPGLSPLLGHWETAINEYLLWSRWPHLRFVFTGANPKEDARAYEARRNAMTYREARLEAHLQPLTDQVKDKDMKVLAELLDMAPIDANLSGIHQSIAAAYIKAKLGGGEGNEKSSEGEMTSGGDPAKKEAHGHQSGVRRNSASESGNK
ncbi:MAG: hypothetical protein KGJ90_00360 [Patescibacteria group bacterium]|nr:hypothetical protein [Patescibacteria group bacterium]